MGNAPIEQLSFYLQRDSTDFYLEDLVVTLSDDATILDRWNKILSNNCEPHRPNHPSYENTYIVIITSEEGASIYNYLRIDSDNNNDIDLVPFKVNEQAKSIYELGIYRCEGLKELVEEIISQE